MISRLRCRHCGWDNEIPHLRIPRYGARIRCPECGGIQTILPVQADDTLRRPELTSVPATIPRSGITPISEADAGGTAISRTDDPAVVRSEARQLLDLWLKELQRDHTETITTSHVFTDHSDELAHLYGLWQSSFPGEQATEMFREELISTLGGRAGGFQPAVGNVAEKDG